MARIAGIDVYLHVTFLLLLAYFAFVGWQGAGGIGALFFATLVILLFGCVLLHEFGHAFAGRFYGINTPDITLLPIGGVARMDKMPDQPMEEMVVALAGPMVNVVIALGLGLVMLVSGILNVGLLLSAFSGNLNAFPNLPTALLHILLLNNVILVVFNLVPAFPMDGGRVLRALLAMTMPFPQATQLAAAIGKTLAIGFAVIGLLYSPMLILLAAFVFIGAQQEARSVQLRSMTNGVGIREVLITHFKSLSPHASLHDAIDALLSSYQHDFPVVDESGRYLGLLTRTEMLGSVRQSGFDIEVAMIMRRDIQPVPLSIQLEEAMQRLEAETVSALPVVDTFGRVIGLLASENISEMVLVREAISGSGR